jgi:hypothetical protein
MQRPAHHTNEHIAHITPLPRGHGLGYHTFSRNTSKMKRLTNVRKLSGNIEEDKAR